MNCKENEIRDGKKNYSVFQVSEVVMRCGLDLGFQPQPFLGGCLISGYCRSEPPIGPYIKIRKSKKMQEPS